MRGDRLLSILMLLQARGQMTAQKLATELEVSERTIYRDIDALSIAGVPVYAERGPGGGIALLDSYRTTLTGLTGDEARALFMLSIPAPLTELGVDRELRAALRKLAAALPDSRRSDEQRARQRIHLDLTGWSEAREPVPHLKTIQEAVWQNRRLFLTYRLAFGARAEWLVEPEGLVAKANTWYLVCRRDGHRYVYRVSRILEAALSEGSFDYPEEFDLAAFWRDWCVELERNRPSYSVTARVSPDFVPWLSYYFGESVGDDLVQKAPPGDDGWITVTLPFETLEEARDRILSFGRAVEVLAPRGLCKSIQDYASQIVALYQQAAD